MQRRDPGFGNTPLTDMVAVGVVDAHSARIWMRSERLGKLEVEWWPTGDTENRHVAHAEVEADNESDNTAVAVLPDSAGDDAPALRPVTEYRYRVSHARDRHLIGEGRFETFPEERSQMDSRFAVGIMSCHQPFEKDGQVRPSAPQMLRATKTTLDEHNTKFVLQLGDQMYSDYPAERSLVDPDYLETVAPSGQRRLRDCSTAEVRRLYQERYRYFWNFDAWKEIQAEYPCYPILDDHDIIDNWGSDPRHQEAEWQSIGEGAKLAYLDYQGARMHDPAKGLPRSFHYTFDYGSVSTFIMDLRSERKAGEDGQLFSKDQEEDFKRFLERNSDRSVLLVVLSVPLVHLPRLLTRIVAQLPPSDEDFSDRWSSGRQIEDRDRFLKILHRHQQDHPDQRLVLASGDIHVGCAHKIMWHGGGSPLYQFVSSGITHETGPLFEYSARFLMWLKRSIATVDETLSADASLLPAIDGTGDNPYGKVNFGILEFDFSAADGFPRMQFFVYGHDGDDPVCAYRSPVV